MAIENKNCMAGSADRLALRPMLFLEAINGNDVPRPIFRQIPDPGKVRHIARETVSEMNYFFYAGGYCGKLADAMC